MIVNNSPVLQIYAQALPCTVRILADDLALHRFRESHPAEYANTGNFKISSIFEDHNLLNLSRTFFEHAGKSTSGCSMYYFRGLVFAHKHVKESVDWIFVDGNSNLHSQQYALNTVEAHLEKVCKARYETLYSNTYRPDLAFDFAVLEMATFLLIHTHPETGKMWSNRLYYL